MVENPKCWLQPQFLHDFDSSLNYMDGNNLPVSQLMLPSIPQMELPSWNSVMNPADTAICFL